MKHKPNENHEKTDSLAVYLTDRATVRAIAGARGQLPAVIVHEAITYWVTMQPAHIQSVEQALAEVNQAADDRMKIIDEIRASASYRYGFLPLSRLGSVLR